jgi:hypothetical protein
MEGHTGEPLASGWPQVKVLPRSGSDGLVDL